jgi:biopolymer transport protein TolQ
LAASAAFSLLLQVELLDYVRRTTSVGIAVLAILFIFSVSSWTIIFSKWSALRRARNSNARFLRAFRKANGLEAVMVASEQFRPSPLVSVFDFGYTEINRQVQTRGGFSNKAALERSLQLGTNEELARLEHNLNWLATTASVSPFIGLFGTVLGIIRAFEMLGSSGGTSLASVGPGISEALFATAVGLFAAIPAAVFYNHFGHMLKELGARMDDFSLEFINLAERSFGE